jgi:hypothetical protein
VRACNGFVEDIGFKNGHGAAANYHGALERHDGGRQELLKQSHLVHHVADDGGEEFAARGLKVLLI